MAGIHSADVRAERFSGGAPAVTGDLFGGNFLFDRDQAVSGGSFDAKAEALGASFLRYPGGTIAEQHFDITDPDRTADDGARGPLEPLSDFIAYAAGRGAGWALVLPMNEYAHAVASGAMTMAAARAELRGFLEALKAGAYGAHMPEVIELGNEFYDHAGMGEEALAAIYAPAARAFAEEIRAAMGGAVEIAVQAGRTEAANGTVMEAFARAGGLVDSVIVHSYPWTVDQIVWHHDQRLGVAEAWRAAGLAEGVFLSEWNMANDFAAGGVPLSPLEIERGMAQAAAMIELLAGFAKAGVTRAAVWPIQQNTPGDLGGDEGEWAAGEAKLSPRNLTLAGESFRLMSEVLPGLKPLETANLDIDGAAEAARFRDEFLIEAFQGDGKIVVFVSAFALTAGQLGSTVRLDIDGAFAGATVTTLRAGGPDPLDPNAPALVGEARLDGVRSAADLALVFSDAYEIKRVVFDLAPEQEPRADASSGRIVGGSGDDRLRGGETEEIIVGRRGEDTLRAGDGDDLARGGGGADRLAGQRGDDLLIGGPGADHLRGGGGADALRGGGGGDKLIGNGGGDTLAGGKGDDVLKGGGGADLFVFRPGDGADIVKDFTPGLDRLSFEGGLAPGDLTLVDGPDGAFLSWRGGSALLDGVSADALGEGDFLF